MGSDGHSEREHFFGAAKVVAALTVLSRVLGMVRDMAILAMGATRRTDAFWVAFKVPNVFRRLFGEGALAAAFVPVFTDVSEAHGWDRARLVLANAAGLLALVLAVILVLAEVFLAAVLLWTPLDWDNALLVRLVMLLLPFMFTICLLALGSAALQCKGHFAYPAFAPILLNIFLIAAAAAIHLFGLGAGDTGLYLLCLGTVAAGVTQLIGVVWLLGRMQLAAMPRLRPLLSETRRVAGLILPMMIPLGVVQFSSLFNGLYAWVMTAATEGSTITIFGWSLSKPLTEGVVTRLYAAERMYNFPLGILAISLATAVFPLFSRYAARNDISGLRQATNRALRLCLFLGVPAGVALMLLARPALTLIYCHGDFLAKDADRAADILRLYCIGMWAYFANHILLRAFFAQKDTRIPMHLALWRAIVNILLVMTLVFTPLAAGVFGMATAVTSSVHALVLVWILHRRWGHIGLGRILRSVVRTAVATACMAGAILAVCRFWPADAASLEHWTEAGKITGVCIVCGGVAFLVAAWAMRSRELAELWGAARHEQPDEPAEPL
ncbi:MAG: murein biosynthesis integral membrane protein MurJ [Phycisphaerae bacterium]|jgi:putative peptidoglycan lipid II flippase|nr:murein biosynthesis integral membrane protein MurJ [Phycisphaerae bacterium]